MKRTINGIRTASALRAALGIALAAALVPAGSAFAETMSLEAGSMAASAEAAQVSARAALADTDNASLLAQFNDFIATQADQADDSPDAVEEAEFEVVTPATSVSKTMTVVKSAHTAAVETAAHEAANKLLAYDPAAIDAIGTQERTGHTICCPSFSCAYADAVLDGTIHSHDYYTCTCCTWTDWGGGNSSFRCVGTDEQLLREAFDQITAGRPTVIHVRASYGEHWIALIGYENATDPDHLTLGNFIALDPWDGAQINAASRFALYGDGCEHISDR